MSLDLLKAAVRSFIREFNAAPIRELYGVDNGKAIGTHVERLLHRYLGERYSYVAGNSAIGIDFPEVEVDLKVTSVWQPQSSSPFRDILARDGNKDDVLAFLEERNLPLDDVGRSSLADRILRDPPRVGYLTVSNALQSCTDSKSNRLAVYSAKLDRLPLGRMTTRPVPTETLPSRSRS